MFGDIKMTQILITIQTEKCYKPFELGLKEGPIPSTTSRRWTKGSESIVGQDPRNKEELKKCVDTLGSFSNCSTLFSFCFLQEFRLKYLVSQIQGRLFHSLPKWHKWKEGSKLESSHIGSQDNAEQLWTNQQAVSLLADSSQASGIRPSPPSSFCP